ncbi:MAG: hypothetical protein GXY57_03650 [Erysipelotrichaceae bacterium]|jgi:hypothetical protein|nr:hypothetical protein [Erysipelotrichaceae bacterium]
MQFTLPAFLLSLLFGALFLTASFVRYKNKYKVSYNVRNMFPYELNYKSTFIDNFYGNVGLILTLFSFGFFFSTFDLRFDNIFFIIIFITGVLTCVFFLGLVFIPLDFIRLHSIIFILYLISSFLLPVAISIGAFTYNQQTGYTSQIPPIVFISAFIVALVVLAILLNPKLNLNIRMTKEYAEDGSVKYIRPKFITMAFTQWLLFFVLYINEILLFVLTLTFTSL